MADTQPPVIVWFRRELRLSDHEALVAAAQSGAPVLPLYILDDDTPGNHRMGGASRWWLHQSLKALDASLAAHGGSLILRKGAAPKIIAALLDETRACAIHATQNYQPADAKNEEAIAATCAEKGVAFHLHAGRLLFSPTAIVTKDGGPYRVFTPFWKACLAAPEPGTPRRMPSFKAFAASRTETLDSFKLLSTKPDWAGGLRAAWSPGEQHAQTHLAQFIENGLKDYADKRDDLDGDPTSRLSPHLHFGEISPAQIWHAVRHADSAQPGLHKGSGSYLRELGWRDFSYHLLHRFPGLPEDPLRSEFSRFPWRTDVSALKAWQSGATGYPVVDAAMRQLWQTGWMPGRARMIVASFLIKHLLIPWQEGEAWFWDTLVDADLANNAASWQWVAGCGADAAPYFRIFNPVLQAQKFDPGGDYVRRWVPELAGLSTADIHTPWRVPDMILAQAGVQLGGNYPAPIVDHGAARIRALKAFETIKRS